MTTLIRGYRNPKRIRRRPIKLIGVVYCSQGSLINIQIRMMSLPVSAHLLKIFRHHHPSLMLVEIGPKTLRRALASSIICLLKMRMVTWTAQMNTSPNSYNVSLKKMKVMTIFFLSQTVKAVKLLFSFQIWLKRPNKNGLILNSD